MAGMLPGVEIARRRRCWGSTSGWSEPPSPSSSHNYGSSSNFTRRSSLCLYTSNHNSLLNSTSNSHRQQRRLLNNEDEKIGVVAREAKERLDERLRAQYRRSEPKRRNSQERLRVMDQDQVNSVPASVAAGGGLKKSASKWMISWAKFSSWKSSEQDECAVCLEQFRDSDNLAHLPCAHRFHSSCLVPWLENNAHCPCCRNPI